MEQVSNLQSSIQDKISPAMSKAVSVLATNSALFPKLGVATTTCPLLTQGFRERTSNVIFANPSTTAAIALVAGGLAYNCIPPVKNAVNAEFAHFASHKANYAKIVSGVLGMMTAIGIFTVALDNLKK